MKRRPFLLSLALVFLTLNLIVAKPARPNILYLYADDWGWGGIGPNGQAERRAQGLPHVLTPNLDRLAAQGINFTRSYGCTVCSPARSSQQTGFHQGHTFADRNDPDNAKKAIRTDDLTMGDMLSRAGYVTGYWGKWGYGGSKSQPAPVIENIQTLPTSHGYQHVVAELHHVRAHTFFQPTLWTAPAPADALGGLVLKPNSMQPYRGNRNYPDTPALQSHPAYPATAYCDDVYSFAALDFVRRQATTRHQSGKPFFALLAMQVPHAPFQEIEALPEWDRAYRDQPYWSRLSDQAKQWAAMVTRLDAHIGNLLAALEDPNNDGDKSDSVADNTLVIFQSDNGGPQHPARNEFAANGGLRASKGKIEEGGIRIPTIMRWPAKITSASELKPGTSTDMILDVTDLLPTFCELAGVTTPLGIDGVSIAPTLTGSGRQRQREYVIHEAGNGQSIIRGSDKLIRRKKGYELYDLTNDPAEANDLAAKRPKLVAELKEILLAEHVAEPRDFANTYHHWTGDHGADLASADNWSDYRYANAGITYLTDEGAPRSSWIALLENQRPEPSSALATRDVEVLALEIRGQQALLVERATITGRNEIRISDHATIQLRHGKLRSQRWVEILAGGRLTGTGAILADVHNSGTMQCEGGPLRIKSDYQETPESRLVVDESAAIAIDGTARLAGELSLRLPQESASGKTFTILTASQIEGRFSNATVSAPNGTRYDVIHTPTSVEVKRR